MKNLVMKIRKLGVVAVCLTLVLGIMGVCGVKVKANAPVIMQTIYTNNEKTEATLVVKVSTDYFNKYGVTLICKNPNTDSEEKVFEVKTNMGSYVDFGNGNSASWYYSAGENCYEVTFKIQRSTIPVGARAYFQSGDAQADNGGYGYYLFE